MVKAWRKRWESCYQELCIFEKGKNNEGVSDKQLLEKMLEILSDHYRSGKPIEISSAQRQQIIALCCEHPHDHDIPITQWTHKLLAEVAIKKGIVKSISSRHVGRILKKK